MKTRIYFALLLVWLLATATSRAAVGTQPPGSGGSGGGTNVTVSVTNGYAGTGAARVTGTNISIAPVFTWDGSGANTNAPGVILDMDYGGDVDDAIDLKLACKLHQMGLIRLLAVTHSSSNDWGASSISAALAYYGVKVPVGISKVPTGVTLDIYGSFVATNTANPAKYWFTNSNDAKDIMRYALANSPNSNVVIITTGPLNNLQRLIDSIADANSPLTGSQLLAQKLRPDLGVVPVVCYFTNSSGGLNSPEYNGSSHLNALNWVNNYVPNSFPVTFFGEEVFETVQTGLGWQTNLSSADPVFNAMRLAAVASRPAWAQGALMLVGYGTNWTVGSATGSNVFGFSGGGTNQITAGGSNTWWNGTYVGQKYVIRLANTNWLADIVNSLVMPAPQDAKDYLSRNGDDTWSGKKSGTNDLRLYVGANPSGYISQIFARNNASTSGVMTLQDYLAQAATHFFFGLHEDNYFRGGRNQSPDNGYNFFNTIAGDNNNVFGNGANSNVFNSVVIISNLAPSSILILDANGRVTNATLDASVQLTGTTISATGSGGGGTNTPVVLLLAGNTNLALQQGKWTVHYQITNLDCGADFDLAVPTSGQLASLITSNSAPTNILVTVYTNGQPAAVYDVATKTNITSWPVVAGGVDETLLRWMGTYWQRTFKATEGRLAAGYKTELGTNGQNITVQTTQRYTNYAEANITVNASTDVTANFTNAVAGNRTISLATPVIGTSGTLGLVSDGSARTLAILAPVAITWLSTNDTATATNILTTASKRSLFCWRVSMGADGVSTNISCWVKNQTP